jgi:hypothetical protein
LDRVRARIHQGPDHFPHVFDALEEPRLVEKTVVDGHVKTPAGTRIEQTLETIGFHEGKVLFISHRADA